MAGCAWSASASGAAAAGCVGAARGVSDAHMEVRAGDAARGAGKAGALSSAADSLAQRVNRTKSDNNLIQRHGDPRLTTGSSSSHVIAGL
jgi:hypothetical protein